MYQPADGDTVTVTRTHPNGRKATWIGVLSDVFDGGFRITGTGPNGLAADTYMGSSADLLRYHDIVQTVTPYPEQS